MSQIQHQIFGVEYDFPLTKEKLMEIACAESHANTAELKKLESNIMGQVHDFKGQSPKGYFDEAIKEATFVVQRNRLQFLTHVSLNHPLEKAEKIQQGYLKHVEFYNAKASKPLFAVINDGRPIMHSNIPWSLKFSFAITIAVLIFNLFSNYA